METPTGRQMLALADSVDALARGEGLTRFNTVELRQLAQVVRALARL